MVETAATTRRRLADRLREEPGTPAELGREFSLSPSTVLTHLEHLAHSLQHDDEELLVAPPECRECGFDDFDDLLNRPSRCPSCKHEGIREPTVTIR
ncbi:putative transcriptional regulator containing an HTH domain fused to a Zn-ribbon [Halovivax ruber XH-70]|uniref:Putative transcriptional regulator containing an HTH domain fused to a Zn-ribbon n=1 Tax=Halovivax ruber (strain DSM 18193 / JCM 13892 / XH-70) TaxID=797302 RepID=L0IFP2_HALRX|nr:transcriptional regulator [Halovivax ruber]AGB17046.1 putative transcriptional regulator containing an HTH domain fused to a Zn-ribbon [Halovivax ruber XH-70]